MNLSNLINLWNSVISLFISFIRIIKAHISYFYYFQNGFKAFSQQVSNRISFLFLFSLFICIDAYPQKTFRRHFIIAYDVSAPFIKAEKEHPIYKQALINLFSGKPVTEYNEAYQNNLAIEEKNGLIFFDKNNDEISFFHFNIAESEFDGLRLVAHSGIEKEIITDFNRDFLKNKNVDWSAYSKNANATISDYINSLFSLQPVPPDFKDGVSMSNFVYPLILNKLDTSTYAEEYVLIILSDFKAGMALGNTKDLDRVKDIFRVPYKTFLPSTSPVSYIKSDIDFLSSQYYKIDFFQFSFGESDANNILGILSYKIKPKIGVLTPEDVSLFVDGDLNLDQQGYRSKRFKTSGTDIKFTHNKNLTPIELRLTISEPTGKVLFDDVVASKDDADIWTSKYTDNEMLMSFDSSKLTYFIPPLSVSLDSSVNKKDFENLKFGYEFKTKYAVGNIRPLNFIYKTERALPVGNIDYSTKATIIIMYYLIPAFAVILLIFLLVAYGKPKKILFRISGFLDSFEIINYKTVGKLLTPYKAWDTDNLRVDHLLVKGELVYKSSGFPLNWNSPVYLQLYDVSVPAGFEVFLKYSTKDLKEFGSGNAMTIKKDRNHQLSFIVGIRQNDITKKFIEPEPAAFKIEAVVKDSRLFIKSELRETIEYNFHIGPELGDVWVGFDPGTSGSCIAVGSETDNIILGESRRNTIIPSTLVFDAEQKSNQNNFSIPDIGYKYGILVEPSTTGSQSRYIVFQSIKKLLGFRDIKEIRFEDKNVLKLRGKDLASLLIKGLFKDVKNYFSRENFRDSDYKRNGKFNPMRAVIAIPNNFTISKIQDVIDCVDNLNQFKEIRYVYEAEAVLFYYLSNFTELIKDEKEIHKETILVFDMGGATINATVVTTNKTMINERLKYDIDFLGKIGYGIGGDTIDYCISKFVLNCKNEFSSLVGVDIVRNKTNLAALAFDIKVEIIRNYYVSKNEFLITAYNLRNYIQDRLNITLSESPEIFENSDMYSFFKKQSGRFKLFEHPLFVGIIYNNVRDAVKEVVALSGDEHIDKIIFSGRSTAFPMIKETVEKQLNDLKVKDAKTKSIPLDLYTSKVAVAKGACWYGINKNSVRLNNLKTNAAFGFKRTLSADRTDAKFYELIGMGCSFDERKNGIDSFEGTEKIAADFAFDGSKVNFYQIMGKDADKILSEGQKHKFSKIASINLDQVTSEVAMRVNENDEVECAVELESNRIITEKGVVSDQEIEEANEEHYTWIVK